MNATKLSLTKIRSDGGVEGDRTRSVWRGLTLLFAIFVGDGCLAQTPASSASPVQPPATAPAAGLLAPAGSEVLVELTEAVGTRRHRPGDRFGLKLAEPLVVAEQVVIPAGTTGEGEIIDVARPGMSGRPAKLVLAARYVDIGGTRVPLHGFRLGGVGESRRDTAVIVAYVVGGFVGGVVGLAIPGGDLNYPAGARARARILADVRVPPPPDPSDVSSDAVAGVNP
jgi:hypothetical protein